VILVVLQVRGFKSAIWVQVAPPVGYFFLHSQSPFCNLCSNPTIINNRISDTISFSKSKARGQIQLQISLCFKEVSDCLTVSHAMACS
jgi:hypothetical protein